MRSFIHLLNSPACITSFDGRILDANSWFQKSFKAKSKTVLLKSNLLDLVIDGDKYRLFTDHLLSGRIIQNEKLYVKNFDGKPDTKFTFASVLSFEKQQIFIQIFEIFLYNHPTIDRAESILKEISTLSPYLNNTGKERLSEIINTHENILKGNELTSRLAHLKHKLGYTCPKLSRNEIDISALLIIGFSTMEISIYGGYPATKVRTALFQICKKMEVNSLEELLGAYKPINFTGRYYPESSNLLSEEIKKHNS